MEARKRDSLRACVWTCYLEGLEHLDLGGLDAENGKGHPKARLKCLLLLLLA